MLAITMTTAHRNATSVSADRYVVVRPESPGRSWGFWTEADALAAVGEHIERDGVVAGWSLGAG